MGLVWLLQSACTIVLGHPTNSKDTKMEGGGAHNEEVVQGVVKSFKCFPVNGDGPRPSSYSPGTEFQMPLHYPRYKKADYQKMEEWRLDLLLRQYGLKFEGTLDQKRTYAIGAFLWPDQL